MLRGNRLLIVALGLVVGITIAIGWSTWPASPHLTNYGEANPINSDYRPGGHECESKSLAAIRNNRERVRQADACAKESEEYRQQASDLIQQTRAADAAKAQADIASQQLWAGWLQTLGGFLTLAAAVGAAVYARDAAFHGKRSADFAETLIFPKIILDNPVIQIGTPDQGALTCQIDMRYVGGGDAYNCFISYELTIFGFEKIITREKKTKYAQILNDKNNIMVVRFNDTMMSFRSEIYKAYSQGSLMMDFVVKYSCLSITGSTIEQIFIGKTGRLEKGCFSPVVWDNGFPYTPIVNVVRSERFVRPRGGAA